MTSPAIKKNFPAQIEDFLASARLTLTLLITLALTSVIGTLVPQQEPLTHYLTRYGEGLTRLFYILNLMDMYHSWWFLSLLALLTANLIVCSIRRLKGTLKILKAAPRTATPELFPRLTFSHTFKSPLPPGEAAQVLTAVLKDKYGRVQINQNPGQFTLYTEKGSFGRLGVFIVHGSLLIIFIGVLIGSFFGFHGFMELKEGETKEAVRLKGSGLVKPIPFKVRLEKFSISFYPNGMPSEYRSRVHFAEPGDHARQADIIVNDPATFKGVTFYQSSYETVPANARVLLKENPKGPEIPLTLSYQEPVPLAGQQGRLTLLRYEANFHGLGPALGILYEPPQGEKEGSFVLAKHPRFHGNRLGPFQVSVQSVDTVFASGFQVAKDPGVWLIWAGCTLMVFGFLVVFFLSHRQIWVLGEEQKGGTQILVGGNAHKNRISFEQTFAALAQKMEAGSTRA
jgi:cytochrome c biogenesis protein